MARKTFLYEEHVRLDGKLVDFQGWVLPVQYSSILAEHNQCRTQACLFDTGHMGQIMISGPNAADDLSSLLTQNAHALPVGRSKYGLLLNDQCGVLDDSILMRLGQDDFLLVVNAGPLVTDVMWMLKHASSDTVLTDQTSCWGKLDLQGPASFDVLSALVDVDIARLGYFCVTYGKICGLRCIISRTGYTGELGYEIFIPAQNLTEVFRSILADDRVLPAGLGARDLLRLEMCYGLYGEDITAENNPYEADLDYFVKLDHEFVGSKRLAELANNSPARKLIAFKSTSRRKPPRGGEIWHDGRFVGQVTSGAYSPSLGLSIGMGYIPTKLAEVGTELVIRGPRVELNVTVAKKPLYTEGSCRKKINKQ